MKRLDIALLVVFGFSVASLFLANEDPFARDSICAHTGFCPVVPHAQALNKFIYDLSVGAIVTMFFYLLVVRLPDYERRQRLKQSLQQHYRAFREDCTGIMLEVADGSYSADLPEALLEQDRFRAYFKESVAPGRDRWDEFQNNLDEYHLRGLLTRMAILRDEIAYVLNNTDIPKDEPFEFLKQLSGIIYSMRDITLGYDESKPLIGFLWNVFAGWDLISGYRKRDVIKRMIAAI